MRLVGLLRAVNVGGTGKLPMAALRALVAKLGFADVETFIQTGNVLFDAPGVAGVAEKIEAGLREEHGLHTTVILRTPAELAAVARAHAFADRGADPTRLHVVFLLEAPAKAAVARLDPSRSPGDAWRARGRDLHLFLPNGAGRSKLTMAYLERILGTAGTMRNLNTVTKLAALAARG